MHGRRPQVLAIAVTILLVAGAGALAGRAVSTAVLPGPDEMTAIADSLVPPGATHVRADDLDGSSVANLNIFVAPAPPTATRAWRVEHGPDEELARIVAELRDRGWQVVEGAGRSVRLADGHRTVRVRTDPPFGIRVSATTRPGGWFLLPTLTAVLGGLAVAALWRAVRRTRPGPGVP